MEEPSKAQHLMETKAATLWLPMEKT